MADNTSKSGFGAMDDKQREIANQAGKKAQGQNVPQEKGLPQEFISEETHGKGKDMANKAREQAKDLGKKGGESSEGTNMNR